MTHEDVTDLIYSLKIQKGIKWADVAKNVGQSKEWVTAACLVPSTSRWISSASPIRRVTAS